MNRKILSTKMGFFYQTRERIERDTTIKPDAQRKIIQMFSEYGIIEVKTKGLPKQNYYRIIHDQLWKFLSSSSTENPRVYKKYINKNILIKSSKDDIHEQESARDIAVCFNNKKQQKSPDIKNIENNELDTIILYWNSQYTLSNKKITRHLDKNSKTWQRILYILSTLTNGTFYRNFHINIKYSENNKIVKEILHKKFSANEIKSIIDNYILYLNPEYGSPFKDKYPKSFADFLFNNQTKTSFFFAIHTKGIPSKCCTEAQDKKVADLYRTSLFKGKKMNDIELNEFNRGVNFVITRKKEYMNMVGQYFCPYHFQNDKFYTTHITFIRERYIDSGVITVSHIGVSTYWKKYIISG